SFVSIQFHGQLAPQPGSELGDLGYFHDESLKILSPFPKKRHPATLVPKEPFMYWEVSFDVNKFQSFHGIADSEMPSFSLPQTAGSKRKNSGALSGAITVSSKKARSISVSKPAPLVSTFAPRVPRGMSEVVLLFGSLVYNEEQRRYLVSWPDNESLTTTRAYLSDSFVHQGAFKNVYELQLEGQKWVAKRFYNTDGKETVSAKVNEEQLGLEAARLQDAKDIYKEFVGFAKKQGVAIADPGYYVS
ncbi:hypothetical protein MPER_08318, partial [Moniliophthora perniciosa FA553]